MLINQEVILGSRPAHPIKYRLAFAPLPDNLDKKFERWEWVLATDLLAHINASLRQQNTEKHFLGVTAMLRRFALLNRKEDGRPLYTWINKEWCVYRMKDLPDNLPEDLMIPDGWADRIEWAADNGIINVTVRGQNIGSHIHYDLVGELWNGTPQWLHDRGGQNYRLVDIPW
jgi:hypothetical protein